MTPEVELYESKLQQPWSRPGLVPRTAVIDRLLGSRAPITAVVAPAGYGKTTLLTQWSERSGDRSAWVSLDERDNDPAILLGYVAAALDRIEPIDPGILGSLASPGVSATAHAFPLLASILSSRHQPSVLFLDHLEMVESRPSTDLIAQLALHLPAASRLVLASRREPPLPMARLRAQASILEIGVDDLRMSQTEANALLAGADVRLDTAEMAVLLERTEGWPVGLYLAALALKANGRDARSVSFDGDDRTIADYLRSEVLAHLTPSTAVFLRRTSVLDRLSGPLCDAVLGGRGSRQILESLEQSNLLLVPLDQHREWYRYHSLFKDLLAAELSRVEPELIPLLHDRAAAWLEVNGLPDVALDHAQSAGDAERAARLFATVGQRTYATGRLETALRWRRWFSEQGLEERYPQVAMLGGITDALLGRVPEAERAADVARRGSIDGPLPDGSPLDAWVAVLDASLCTHGVAQMRADARRARGRLATSSPWLGPALFLEGLADVLDGDLDAADPTLDRAVQECTRSGGAPTAAAALGERAAIAIERRQWSNATTLAAQALTIVQHGRCDEYLTSIAVLAVAARTAAHEGEGVRARQFLARATRLRPLCSSAFPASAHLLLHVARAHLDLADTAGARTVLRQVGDILVARPDLGAVPTRVAEVQALIDATRLGAIGSSSLTVAELRLLPYLATHFTFREIGDRIHVSRHTVKSQAMAIYGKLGVSSRSAAIQRARDIGLLDA